MSKEERVNSTCPCSTLAQEFIDHCMLLLVTATKNHHGWKNAVKSQKERGIAIGVKLDKIPYDMERFHIEYAFTEQVKNNPRRFEICQRHKNCRTPILFFTEEEKKRKREAEELKKRKEEEEEARRRAIIAAEIAEAEANWPAWKQLALKYEQKQ